VVVALRRTRNSDRFIVLIARSLPPFRVSPLLLPVSPSSFRFFDPRCTRSYSSRSPMKELSYLIPLIHPRDF